MTSQRDLSWVVVQLTGGNDAMNTVAPYTNGVYRDSRSAIRLTKDDLIDPDHRNVITGVNFGRGLPGPCTTRAFPPLNSLTTSMAHSSSSA